MDGRGAKEPSGLAALAVRTGGRLGITREEDLKHQPAAITFEFINRHGIPILLFFLVHTKGPATPISSQTPFSQSPLINHIGQIRPVGIVF